jgi:hypothetical protein
MLPEARENVQKKMAAKGTVQATKKRWQSSTKQKTAE